MSFYYIQLAFCTHTDLTCLNKVHVLFSITYANWNATNTKQLKLIRKIYAQV